MKFTKIAAALAALLISGDAALAQQALRFGHVGEPGSLFAQSAEAFARIANEKLAGKAEVQVFGSSQLGNDREMLQKLKLGQMMFALPSSVMSSVAPEFGVFEMPYIIQDREHIKAVEREMLLDVFNPAAEAQGYRILAFWENGFRHITNNVRPVTAPSDLEGVKLRTPNGEWRVKMFQAYGANPTPMAFSDVFTALQTGVIDGQENPYAQIASAKFQEVQKYLSITGHVYTPGYILTSTTHFDRLDRDVQAALILSAREAQAEVYAIAERLEVELLDVIKAAGVAVNEADKAAFVEASRPIYDEFAATVDGGAALVERINALRPATN
ncbi:TRAP transporter substrate-binding protein [Rubrimonas cliftonensis]|uniref:Tripartite ATP-independent transporter solute receptor, DctP family n=1 Tax=Rubrimonas cliftonensis TaxID=89524 RepID=A0A1H4AK40_9RHOB|nr:TRAP transporter substrate-binding protein [Rubrimonas cliftonensis]SEA36034.1 tripartite ATP-independent transporter solute receptor, DctP family [Rubrimonas cliftonensis]